VVHQICTQKQNNVMGWFLQSMHTTSLQIIKRNPVIETKKKVCNAETINAEI
jgi:hypothetical protein